MTAGIIRGDTATAARLAKQNPNPISVDPVVGKDILELLSSAMYVDPRAIYREYIQNAVDAIEAALSAGVLSNSHAGRIEVTVDPEQRSIRVRDNGTGIPSADAERVLTAFGASRKRGKNARGFRGVGRLAAFGYAQTVVFRAKAADETVVTEVHWDCRKLKSLLLDSSYSGHLSQIVRDVVRVVAKPSSDKSLHFFEVELDRVVRIWNDILLNPEEVTKYLESVAPTRFHEEFSFGETIRERLDRHVSQCRWKIFVNGSKEPITRPHRQRFSVSEKKTDGVADVEIIELPDGEGGTRAIVWLLHHSYLGAFHAKSDVRGLRARVGDIQIGDADLFAGIFPEPRFNSWTVGEVHVVDQRIVPNGRRDGFEQNGAYFDLVAQLGPIGRDIARRCRHSSAQRNKTRNFTLCAERLSGLFAELTHRGIGRSHEQRIRREIGLLFAEMHHILKSPSLDDEDRRKCSRKMLALQSQYDGLEPLTGKQGPLSGVSPSRRAAYEQVIDLIYECLPNKVSAQALVSQIMTRLAAHQVRTRRRRKK